MTISLDGRTRHLERLGHLGYWNTLLPHLDELGMFLWSDFQRGSKPNSSVNWVSGLLLSTMLALMK